MKLTKEECKGIIQVVANWGTFKQYLMIKQLIKEYFDLVERIAPIQSKCAVDNAMEYHNPNLIDDYVKQEIAHNMTEFLLKENVVQFEREQDYARFQTVHKGKIYIVKPKGDNDETN